MNEGYIEYFNDQDELVYKNIKSKIKMIIFASIKRFSDAFLALLGLIILFPLMLLIGLLIKIDSKGPILFKQSRTGKGCKTFTLYKFRTMDIKNNVRDFSKKDMHTKVGKILRKTSLDELPQLINIIKGNMSFIGPRPWIVDYYENMTKLQRHRYDVRPGLTGLAQANGRNTINIFDKINYDLEYIKNYSLKQDIKVIFLTIKAVFTGTGADAGKATIRTEINALKNQLLSPGNVLNTNIKKKKKKKRKARRK